MSEENAGEAKVAGAGAGENTEEENTAEDKYKLTGIFKPESYRDKKSELQSNIVTEIKALIVQLEFANLKKLFEKIKQHEKLKEYHKDKLDMNIPMMENDVNSQITTEPAGLKVTLEDIYEYRDRVISEIKILLDDSKEFVKFLKEIEDNKKEISKKMKATEDDQGSEGIDQKLNALKFKIATINDPNLEFKPGIIDGDN